MASTENRSETIIFHEGVKRLPGRLIRAEASLSHVLREKEKKLGKVKCEDCNRVGGVIRKNSMGDGLCPISGKTLPGFFNSKRTLSALRLCAFYLHDAVGSGIGEIKPLASTDTLNNCISSETGKFVPYPARHSNSSFKIGDKVRIVKLREEGLKSCDEDFARRLKAKMDTKVVGTIEDFYFPNGTRPNIDFGDLKATLWEDEIEKVPSPQEG